MTQTKLHKPRTCEQCPVIRIDKGTMTCGAYKKLKAKIFDSTERYNMWKSCLIDWDK